MCRTGGLGRLFIVLLLICRLLFLVAECVLLTNRSADDGLPPLTDDDESGIGVESYLLGGRLRILLLFLLLLVLLLVIFNNFYY